MIEIKNGDMTKLRPENRPITIAHIANCVGAWGAGFVKAIDKISIAPSAAYKAWAREHNNNIPLGMVQLVEAFPGLYVENMIAQNSIRSTNNDGCLVDYGALEKCLKIVFSRSLRLQSEVHMPAGMGSGLGGGDKNRIHALIRECAEFIEKTSNMAKILKDAGGQSELYIALWEYNDVNSDTYIPTRSNF